MGSGTSQSHEADVSHPAPETFEGQLLALLPVMRRYSRSLAKSDAEGEDLLQDCVAKALARRGQWRGLNLRGWILTMMTNLYRNGYKAARAPGTKRWTPPRMSALRPPKPIRSSCSSWKRR